MTFFLAVWFHEAYNIINKTPLVSEFFNYLAPKYELKILLLRLIHKKSYKISSKDTTVLARIFMNNTLHVKKYQGSRINKTVHRYHSCPVGIN